jgi:nucleoside-diphosphate-sugar epimerase
MRPSEISVSRSIGSRCFEVLFGAASLKQVAARCLFDFALVCFALLVAVVFRAWYVEGMWADATLRSVLSDALNRYLHNIVLFAVLAVGLFCGASVYRPLPSSRIAKRVFDIALACGLGSLVHLGTLVLFAGTVSRGIIAPAWLTLFLLVTTSRVIRMHLGQRYLFRPRSNSQQTRTESVLIVGGAGYIGSVLTRQLLEAGYHVRVLDLELFGTESLDDLRGHARFELIHGDFRNVEDVVRALRGMDAVVHLAAIVGDPACAVDSEVTIGVNYAAAKMMAQLARANGISRFVFASTCSVYGASDDIIDEQSELNPVSLYATSKIDAERALLESTDDVFRPTVLRLATAYGWSRRPRFDLVANLLSAQAVTDGEIKIFNGEQWRPFVNTIDIARSMVMVLEAPIAKVGGEVFNVGDNTENYTLDDLGQIVAASVPGTRVNSVRNSDDPRNYRVRFDKIRKVLGYRASVTLEQGVQEIVAAVREGQVRDWRDPIYSNLRQMEHSVLRVLEAPSSDANLSREVPETSERFLQRDAA